MPPLSIHLTKYIINKKVFYLDFLTTSTIFFSFSYLEISFDFGGDSLSTIIYCSQ